MKSIITNFFKAVWLKYYNFIQWTKKWHFCHIIAISTVFFLAVIVFSEFGFYTLEKGDPDGDYRGFAIAVIVMYTFVLYLSSLAAIITQILIILFKKNKEISNKFILGNRIYNMFYTLAVTLQIIHYSLFIICYIKDIITYGI